MKRNSKIITGKAWRVASIYNWILRSLFVELLLKNRHWGAALNPKNLNDYVQEFINNDTMLQYWCWCQCDLINKFKHANTTFHLSLESFITYVFKCKTHRSIVFLNNVALVDTIKSIIHKRNKHIIYRIIALGEFVIRILLKQCNKPSFLHFLNG